MDERREEVREHSAGIGTMIVRIIVSVIVLAIVAFFTPGFSINGLWPLLVAAVVIGIIHFAIEKLFHFDASPFGRGIVGFIVSAAIIYVTSFIVTGFYVTMVGSLIAAVLIGIINAIIPGRAL